MKRDSIGNLLSIMPTWHLAKTQKMVGSSSIVIMRLMIIIWASLMAQMVKKKKKSTCYAGYWGSIPESGRSPGEGNGYPLQCSCLENPHGQRNLAGCSPWGHKEPDMIEGLTLWGFSGGAMCLWKGGKFHSFHE